MLDRLKTSLNALIASLLSFVPQPLPQTPSAHEAWIDSIIALGDDLPNNDSFRQAIATMVLHLPPTKNRASKRYFLKALEKSIANQVAFQAIDAIKQREKTKAANEQSKVLENGTV